MFKLYIISNGGAATTVNAAASVCVCARAEVVMSVKGSETNEEIKLSRLFFSLFQFSHCNMWILVMIVVMVAVPRLRSFLYEQKKCPFFSRCVCVELSNRFRFKANE